VEKNYAKKCLLSELQKMSELSSPPITLAVLGQRHRDRKRALKSKKIRQAENKVFGILDRKLDQLGLFAAAFLFHFLRPISEGLEISKLNKFGSIN
jgi:hypothetical protein